MIARLDHFNPLFKYDNAYVYSMTEEATRGTVYAPTINTYARKKYGGASRKAMVYSHDDQDKWEHHQKEKLSFMMQTKWNGRVYSLEKFVGIHLNHFI